MYVAKQRYRSNRRQYEDLEFHHPFEVKSLLQLPFDIPLQYSRSFGQTISWLHRLQLVLFIKNTLLIL